MKANRPPFALPRARPIMALLLPGVLAACVPAAPQAPAPRRETPPPRPAPMPVTRAPVDWRDAPATPGSWRWASRGGVSTASFGTGYGSGTDLFVLRCEAPVGRVTLQRLAPYPAQAAPGTPLTITTPTLARTVTAPATLPVPAGLVGVAVSLPARDSLLDAMVFARGRFMVTAPGMAPLYLPAWPEVARVVEDCRRP